MSSVFQSQQKRSMEKDILQMGDKGCEVVMRELRPNQSQCFDLKMKGIKKIVQIDIDGSITKEYESDALIFSDKFAIMPKTEVMAEKRRNLIKSINGDVNLKMFLADDKTQGKYKQKMLQRNLLKLCIQNFDIQQQTKETVAQTLKFLQESLVFVQYTIKQQGIKTVQTVTFTTEQNEQEFKSDNQYELSQLVYEYMNQLCQTQLVIFVGYGTFLNKQDSLMCQIKQNIDDDNEMKLTVLYNADTIENTKQSFIIGCEQIPQAYFVDALFFLAESKGENRSLIVSLDQQTQRLLLLQQQINIRLSIISEMLHKGCLLSVALFETETKQSEFCINRKFAQDGYWTPFNSSEHQNNENITVYGGSINTTNEDLQYKMLYNLFLFDMESAYPSAIIYNNICPTTLITHQPFDSLFGVQKFLTENGFAIENCSIIDLASNAPKTKESRKNTSSVEIIKGQFVAFDKTKYSSFVSYIKQTLERKQHLTQYLNELERIAPQSDLVKFDISLTNAQIRTVKGCINKAYGNLSSSDSSIYSLHCASAITAYIRSIIAYTKEHHFVSSSRVLANYTDSVIIQVQDAQQITEFLQKWDIFNAYLKHSRGVTYKMKHQFFVGMFFAQTNYYCGLIANNPVVLPQSLTVDFLDINSSILLVSGFDKNLFSEYLLHKINNIVYTILKTAVLIEQQLHPMNQVQIKDLATQIVDNQIANIKTEMKNTVSKNEFIQKFAFYFSFSKHSSRYESLSKLGVYGSSFYFHSVPKCINQSVQHCILPMSEFQDSFLNKSINYDDMVNIIRKLPMNLFKKGEQTLRNLIQNNRSQYSQTLGLDLEDDECIVRLEYRQNERKKQHFQQIKYSEIEQFVNENQEKYSVHEIFIDTINKMYFDIECDQIIRQIDVLNCVENLIKKFIPDLQPKVILADGDKVNETSYHVIVKNLACERSINLFLANVLDSELKRLYPMLKKGQIVDCSVYKKNGSLRVFNTYKVDKFGNWAKRQFRLPQNTPYSYLDTLPSYTTNVDIKISFNVMFDDKCPYEVQYKSQLFNKSIEEQIIKYTQEKTGIQGWQGEVKDGYLRLRKTSFKPYICFVCGNQHENDGMEVVLKQNVDQSVVAKINCYHNKQRSFGIQAVRKHELEISRSEYDSVLTKTSGKKTDFMEFLSKQIQTQSDIQYYLPGESLNVPLLTNDLDTIQATTIVVKSQLGTGKTKMMRSYILKCKQRSKSVVLLSFRKTFSCDITSKFGIESYQDIQGTINIASKQIVVQIDSVHRIEDASPDVLVIDECESILEQLQNCQKNVKKFLGLLQNSQKVIIMDGLLENRTIEYLLFFRKTDSVFSIYNTYMPKQDHHVIFKPYRNAVDKINIANKAINLLKKKLKIIMMITSKSAAKFINKMIQDAGFMSTAYHGDDAELEIISHKDDEGNIVGQYAMSQQQKKLEDFKSVEDTWDKYDVVIYTGTLTAGVSFEKKHFDIAINVLTKETCSATGFVQGIHRVRDLKLKTQIIYIKSIFNQETLTPKQITNLYVNMDSFQQVESNIDLSTERQFESFLYARKISSKGIMMGLIVKYLRNLGYKMITNEEEASCILNNLHLSEIQEEDEKQQSQASLKQELCQQINKVKMSREDWKMYSDENGIQKLLDEYNGKAVSQREELQMKIEKMKIMRTFGLNYSIQSGGDNDLDGCVALNSLTVEQITYLYDTKRSYGIRNEIFGIFFGWNSQMRPQLEINWMKDCIKSKYRQIREQKIFDNPRIVMLIQLTQFVSNLISELNNKDLHHLIQKHAEIIQKNGEISKLEGFREIQNELGINAKTQGLVYINKLLSLFDHRIVVEHITSPSDVLIFEHYPISAQLSIQSKGLGMQFANFEQNQNLMIDMTKQTALLRTNFTNKEERLDYDIINIKIQTLIASSETMWCEIPEEINKASYFLFKQENASISQNMCAVMNYLSYNSQTFQNISEKQILGDARCGKYAFSLELQKISSVSFALSLNIQVMPEIKINYAKLRKMSN